jgi:hypothetical protein
MANSSSEDSLAELSVRLPSLQLFAHFYAHPAKYHGLNVNLKRSRNGAALFHLYHWPETIFVPVSTADRRCAA